MVCFMFVGQPATLAAMVSPLLLSTLRLASYVKRNFPAAARPLMPVLDAALARKVRSALHHTLPLPGCGYKVMRDVTAVTKPALRLRQRGSCPAVPHSTRSGLLSVAVTCDVLL